MAEHDQGAPVRAVPTVPKRKSPSRQSSDDFKNAGHTSILPNVWPRKSTIVEKVRQQYQYIPLPKDHARVLVLLPREDDDRRIDVSLSIVPFEDLGKATKYEALSYHWDWGNDDTLRPIHIRNDTNRIQAKEATVNDPATLTGTVMPFAQTVHSLTTKIMHVKPNLYNALRHLRLKHEPVTLWVDALCINQENSEEKQYQVSRMNTIYSKASSVLVWLGDSDDRTKKAMSFIKEVIDMPALTDLVNDEDRMQDWSHLIHLMRRSWFSRRWVIQELAFASNATVHCGADTIHWKDFRDAISLFTHEFDHIRQLFKRSVEYDNDFYAIGDLAPLGAKVLVDTINNIFRRNKRGVAYEPIQGLEYLISTLSTFDSSDPRDTIYALQNIAKETCSTRANFLEPPKPDYKKTLLQTYADYVSWVAKSTNSIDVICRRWALPEKASKNDDYPRLSALPSWIQQITEATFGRQAKAARGRTHGDSFVGMPGRKCYDACHGRPAIVFLNCEKSVSSRSEPRIDTGESTDRVSAEFGDSPGDSASQQPEAVVGAKCTATEGQRLSQTCTISAQNIMEHLELPKEKRGREDDSNDNANVSTKRVKVTLDFVPASDQGLRSPAWRKAFGVAVDSPVAIHDDFASRQAKRAGSSSEFTATPSTALSEEFDKAEELVVTQLVDSHRDASLYADGLTIGVISDCTEPIADGVIPRKAVKKLRHACQKDDPDKMWRTLVAERDEYGQNPPPWYERACQQVTISHTSNGHINTRDLFAKTTDPDHVRKYLQRVQAVIWDRCFLEVEPSEEALGKLHGFGPSQTQKGDLVCILFGCSVPCVLRRRYDCQVGEYFLFIGEAYVYGVMDGEAVSSLTEEEISKRTETFRML